MFYDVTIQGCSGGFGEYAMGKIGAGDAFGSEMDCLFACEQGVKAEIFNLADDLPEGIENISGRIHNQRGTLYGYMLGGSDGDLLPHYFSIVDQAATN